MFMLGFKRDSVLRRIASLAAATTALTLGVVGPAVIGAEAASAAPSVTGATIATDQPDYAPGATVTLTGTGWAAGEVVHITVDDSSSQSWKPSAQS